jgi:hypothetical protein
VDESHGTTTQVRIVFKGRPKLWSATILAGRSRVARDELADKSLIRLEGTMLPRTVFLSRRISVRNTATLLEVLVATKGPKPI